jgi:hypothetical protein
MSSPNATKRHFLEFRNLTELLDSFDINFLHTQIGHLILMGVVPFDNGPTSSRASSGKFKAISHDEQTTGEGNDETELENM